MQFSSNCTFYKLQFENSRSLNEITGDGGMPLPLPLPFFSTSGFHNLLLSKRRSGTADEKQLHKTRAKADLIAQWRAGGVQGWAGQGMDEQGGAERRAGQGRDGQGRAGQRRAQGRAGQGRDGQGREGQGRAGRAWTLVSC